MGSQLVGEAWKGWPEVISLFVYGSLRHGGGNERLLSGTRRAAYTGAGWTLHEFAQGAYPVMLPSGSVTPVFGEVISLDIDSTEFRAVEHMEHGAGYNLTPLRVTVMEQQQNWTIGSHEAVFVTLPHDEEAFTFAYFHADDDWIGKEVPGGDWIAHIGGRLSPEERLYRDASL